MVVEGMGWVPYFGKNNPFLILPYYLIKKEFFFTFKANCTTRFFQIVYTVSMKGAKP